MNHRQWKHLRLDRPDLNLREWKKLSTAMRTDLRKMSREKFIATIMELILKDVHPNVLEIFIQQPK